MENKLDANTENNEPVELYQQLDIAIKILESDSEVYRIGIKNAFINQDLDKLNEYCVSYYENQLGGTKYADIPWVFNGLRRGSFFSITTTVFSIR